MARDWIHGFFDATYVRILRAQWPDAVTRKQVAFVAKVAGLRRGARVLDVPCGFGRHARLLARRGMLVVGVDLSRAMIAEARRGGSQPGLLFVRADMRRLLSFAKTLSARLIDLRSVWGARDAGDW